MPEPLDGTYDRTKEPNRRRFLTTAGWAGAVGIGSAGLASCSNPPVATPPTKIEARARTIIADVSSTESAQLNSAALNRAVAEGAKAGTSVVIPGGLFQHEGFTLPSEGKFALEGSGAGATILENVGKSSSIESHGIPGGPYTQDWVLSGLTLTTDRVRRTQVGLDIKLASRFAIRDVHIQDHGVGVRHTSAWACQYENCRVVRSELGWHFPQNEFAPSSPVALHNCGAWDSGTAVLIEGGLEACTWTGGDLAGCLEGVRVFGDDARSITLQGLNFERIAGSDLVVGDDKSGPSSVAATGCRFLRTDRGPLSVDFTRGDGLNLDHCRWTNYETAVRQLPSAGRLTLIANSQYRVDQLLSTANSPIDHATFVTSIGQFTSYVTADKESHFYAVASSQGIQTRLLTGDGKRSVSDTDFDIAPTAGWTCLVKDTSDNSVRHAVRDASRWYVSPPYT